MRYVSLFILILFGCTAKNADKPVAEVSVPVDSAQEFYEQDDAEKNFDYSRFQGIYDHESSTRGFSAILTLAENGNDLSFTLSVAQGNCKGEAKGTIFIMSHEQNFYIGFYETENCQLQFSFMLQDDKIDVKEINICQLHEGGCSFEGSYAKRKT